MISYITKASFSLHIMETNFRVFKTEIPLSFHKGTVIHADKYAESGGPGLNLPITSTLYSDIVIRLTDTNKDCKVYTKNIDLPVYTDQKVLLISARSVILGFIDSETNRYYYTTGDFSKRLGLGIPFYWLLLAGIIGTMILYFIMDQQFSTIVFIPLFAAWLFYILQQWTLNFIIERALDRALTED